MIKALAIDDEPLAINVIEAFCTQLDYIDLQNKRFYFKLKKAFVKNFKFHSCEYQAFKWHF